METMEDKIKKATQELADSFGVSLECADKLVRNGYLTLEGLSAAGRDQVYTVEGIDADEICAAFDRLEAGN